MFYRNEAGVLWEKKGGGLWVHAFHAEATVICIKGQQSSCNYSVTSANGSEESTPILFTL